jgi:nicotinate dehydrogenase subunit A
VTPVASVVGQKVVTLEGLGTQLKPHKIQTAFIEAQASQCGYCQNGFLMTGAALLGRIAQPTKLQIRQELASLQCRCGTHMRYIRAVERAARIG